MRYVAMIATLFSAVPAFAQYEGVIEMKITGGDGDHAISGSAEIHLGKPGVHMKMKMEMGGGHVMEMNHISKFAEPTLVYQIHDEDKTYTVIDASKAAAHKGPERKYTVKKVGQDSIAGFTCTHVQVSDDNKSEFDVWTSKDVAGADKWQNMMGQRHGGGSEGTEGMMSALKKQNLDGFMCKLVAKDPRGSSYTMELVKAKKEAQPASMFEVPASYTKQERAKGPKLPPGAQQQMDEAMKNLTPEQREMVRKQMGGQ